MNENRRNFMRTLSLAGGAALAPRLAVRAQSDQSNETPNILLIVSDDQGYNDLGCYGNPDIITPNLDRLANEGVRLTQFYVTWPACTPSRGSLLTGRYPQRNGTYDMFRNDKVDYGYEYPPEEYAVSPERILGMDTREVLLPRMLEASGHASGIFGKWDLGQLRRFLPLQRGFDEFYGFVNTGIDYYTHERYGVHSMYRGNESAREDRGTYCTDLFLRESMRFMRENRNRPFLCYVPFNAPHIASVLDRPRPVQAPDEYIQMYPGPENGRERRRIEHKAAVTAMDVAIGRMLNWLDETGEAENTIVLFLSDNGGSGTADNGPLRGGKARMFEGGLRVPCVARWPGRIPAGTVCDEFLSTLEVVPTLCNAAGAPLPEGVALDGFDMMPVLRGEAPSKRTEMFWQRRADRAARAGRWKWIESPAGGGLFDLENDLGEQRDLSEEKPDVLAMMKSKFAGWMDEMQAAEPRGPFRDY